MVLFLTASDEVLSVLEQALFTRRRTNAEFTATGLVHHLDADSQLGLNRSSQHGACGEITGPTSGEGGIRTLGTVTRTTVFETAAFDHSATSPHEVGRAQDVRPGR